MSHCMVKAKPPISTKKRYTKCLLIVFVLFLITGDSRNYVTQKTCWGKR